MNKRIRNKKIKQYIQKRHYGISEVFSVEDIIDFCHRRDKWAHRLHKSYPWLSMAMTRKWYQSKYYKKYMDDNYLITNQPNHENIR